MAVDIISIGHRWESIPRNHNEEMPPGTFTQQQNFRQYLSNDDIGLVAKSEAPVASTGEAAKPTAE